jgi:hypothetical protein
MTLRILGSVGFSGFVLLHMLKHCPVRSDKILTYIVLLELLVGFQYDIGSDLLVSPTVCLCRLNTVVHFQVRFILT